MATRTYCDQCGNTLRQPNKFAFGPKADLDAEKNALMQAVVFQHHQSSLMQQAQNAQHGHGYSGLGSLGNAQGGQGGPANTGVGVAVGAAPPPKPMPEVVTIDLCDTCMPIWMTRVQKLTSGSDPD